MLQQTRVLTVIPYFERFLRELPTLSQLAEASQERVLALWSGLGYYRRARMLHAAAKQAVVRTRRLGPEPRRGAPAPRRASAPTPPEPSRASRSGAGPRWSTATSSRVLSRLFAIEEDVHGARGRARMWRLAEQLVPDGDGDPGDWNQALMELGATVCMPRQPACERCPVQGLCAGFERGIAAALPRIAPKRRPIAVRRVAIVLASTKAVLLARRRSDVLFGGLWEPPSAGGDVAALAKKLGVDARGLEHKGEILHVLTHRRMRVEVSRGPLGRRRSWPIPGPEYDAIELVGFERLAARAQATLTRKVLAVAGIATPL